jgi:hypothetical protein
MLALYLPVLWCSWSALRRALYCLSRLVLLQMASYHKGRAFPAQRYLSFLLILWLADPTCRGSMRQRALCLMYLLALSLAVTWQSSSDWQAGLYCLFPLTSSWAGSLGKVIIIRQAHCYLCRLILSLAGL